VTPRETAVALIEQAADGPIAHAVAKQPDAVLVARAVAYLCDAVRDLELENAELRRALRGKQNVDCMGPGR
jgi:hypothetical protein